MNKAAIHFSVLCMLLIALLGCSDKAGNLLTDSSPSATLASTISACTLKVEVPGLTRENVAEFAKAKAEEGWDGIIVIGPEGGTPVVTLQKKISWDGSSPMEMGKLYGFSSQEAQEEAQRITDAFYAVDEPVKVKSEDESEAQLATGSWLSEIGWGQIACKACQIYGVTDNPSGIYSTKTHKLMSRGASPPATAFSTTQEVFEDELAHWAYLSQYYYDRDGWFQGESTVWSNSTLMASDYIEFYYECQNPIY